MDILWIIVGIILVLVGIIGAIVPGIAGPIVSFAALLVLQLKKTPPFEEDTLVIFGVIAAAVTFLDYVVPVWGTKKFGGTKMGVRGSTIGLIIGMFFLALPPLGLGGVIIGPFVGAYIGESMAGQDSRKALKAAFGSFIGFLSGTLMKLVYSAIVAYYFFVNAF